MSEMRRLRYFLAVAESLNFSRAAEQLHIAQPALSRQIRTLEQELGVDLLVRTTHHVALTDAGAYLLAHGPRLVDAADELWRSVGSFGSGEQGSLILAFGTSAGYETAPRLLESVRERLPDLQVSTRVLPLREVFDGLASGALDVGMVRCPPATSELEAHAVRLESQGVLMRDDHPLAASMSVGLEQVAEEPVLLHDREANPGHYDAVLDLFERADREPRLLVRDLVADLTYRPIVEGRAISVVGESVKDALPGRLRWVPLAPPVAFEVSLLVRAHNRPAALDALLRAATESARALGWLDAGTADPGAGDARSH